MVRKNQNRYEWKMPLELFFLDQSREQPQRYATKENYTEPFRMIYNIVKVFKECSRLYSPVEVSG